MSGISPGTILPAKRTPMTLTTQDGLNLVAELAEPLDRPASATLICLHPLPTAEGMMDSHVLRKASFRLPELADLNVLRFNTRGTCSAAGCSEGTFDDAQAERFDVEAAVAFAEDHGLAAPWLLGWSFGTDLALKYGLLPGVRGAVLLSPPLRYTTDDELVRWAHDGRPVTAMVPELDDFLRPVEARSRFSLIPQAEVVAIEGAKHLWVGEKYVRIVLSEIVERVAPGRPAINWEVQP